MKKILLALSVVLFAGSVFAQSATSGIDKSSSAVYNSKQITGRENGAVPQQVSTPLRTLNRNFIGSTYYDVPSNGSMSNRVVAHNDGTISAVWTTMSTNINSRGTGYNYYTDGNWAFGSSSMQRIEDVRTGWGTITSVGNVDIVASHNGSTSLIIGISEKGENDWTFTQLQGPAVSNGSQTSTCLLWPALASTDNIIHLIACTESDAGYLYNGIQCCLVYYRGTFNASNKTITWEEPKVVGNVTPNEASRFNGDSYAIAAKGNTVAIVAVPSATTDAFLWKSTDKGVNFTKTVFCERGPVADTVYMNDGSCAVAIGDDGKVHVAAGTYWSFVETDTSTTYTWWPGVGYMYYWNEDYAPIVSNGNTRFKDPETMAENGYVVIDRFNLDCDDSIWSVNWGVDAYPNYGVGTVSMPQLVAENGNVYLVFSQLLEFPFLDAVSQRYFRGVFATKSTDNGQSFGDYSWLSYNKDCYYVHSWDMFPLAQDANLNDFRENALEIEGESVYAAVAPNLVNGNISMIWHFDYYAGSDIKENTNASMSDNENYIYFLQMTADSIGIYNNTKEVCQGLWIDHTGISNHVISGMKLYPNPAQNSVNVAFNSEESDNAVVTIMNIMGQTVYSEVKPISEGNNLMNININSLRSGVYMINIKTNKGTSTQKLIVR